MTPLKLAISWGLSFLSFSVFFYFVDELSYRSWLLEALGDRNASTGRFDRSISYGLTVTAIAHLANIGLILSAWAHLKNKSSTLKNSKTTGRKLASHWLLFFVLYTTLLAVISVPLEMIWKRETIINQYTFINSSTWDDIYHILEFGLPALVNILFIYLILTVMNRLRSGKRKRLNE
jgi:ABC-type Fe3+ transport system permease subunit